LLKIAFASSTAVRDARLGDVVVGYRVVDRDVGGVNDARDSQLAQLVIDPHLLRSGDHEIAVGENPGHHSRHRYLDLFGSVDVALSLRVGGRCQIAEDLCGLTR
jgi:hypothetical protein